MALNNKTTLLNDATLIRYADKEGFNTAERVGKMLVDLINEIDSSIALEILARESADNTLQQQLTSTSSVANSALTTANNAHQIANNAKALIDTLNSKIGLGGGLVPLNSSGKIESYFLPGFVDDILDFSGFTTTETLNEAIGKTEYDENCTVLFDYSSSAFVLRYVDENGNTKYYKQWNTSSHYNDRESSSEPFRPCKGKLYLNTSKNLTYRWSGSNLVVIGTDLALGETENTAFPGNRGVELESTVAELQTEWRSRNSELTILNVNQIVGAEDCYELRTALIDLLKECEIHGGYQIRKRGLIITYKTTEGWETKQFQGSSIAFDASDFSGDFMDEGNWKDWGAGGSATGNIINVNEIAPLAEGYYTRAKAALAVPDELRTGGRKITFMSAANNWQTWQFVGILASDWVDENYWKTDILTVSLNQGEPIVPDTSGNINLNFEITIDTQLNKESSNPIANKTVTEEFEKLQNGLAASLSVDPSTKQLSLVDSTGNILNSVTLPDGGGGTTNPTAIELTINSSTSGTIKEGDNYEVEFTWRHYNINTNIDTQYSGRAELIVNGSSVANKDIAQGISSFSVGEWLSVGTNSIRIKITADDGIIAQSAYIKLTVVTLKVASPYSLSTITEKGTAIPFRYVVTGSGTKVVNFILDGSPLETETITTSGATNVKSIQTSALSHGAHSLVVYAEREISDGVMLTSNELYFDLMITENGNETVIIATEFNTKEVEQYSTIVIPFSVYNPKSVSSEVEIYVNGNPTEIRTVDRSRQTFSYRARSAGDYTIQICVGAISKTLTFKVIEAEVQVNTETDALVLHLSSSGRSNNSQNASYWSYTDENGNTTTAQFENCGFDDQSGWKTDSEGVVSLHLTKGAKCVIPYLPFADDCKSTGKVIEIEFSCSNCYDQDAVLISCLSGSVGFEISAQECYLSSALKKRVSTKFKQDERIRVSFIIQSVAEKRFMFLVLNGKMSNVIQYDTSDYFIQNPAVGITFGHEKSELDIHNILVYDNALSFKQMVDNFIADMDDTDIMFKKLEDNDILNEDSAEAEIDYNKVVEKIPCITFIGALPSYKGDKKKDTKIVYEDRLHPEFSFTCNKNQNDVQGTSSQYYPRKNWKFKFLEDLIYTLTGQTASKYALRGVDGNGNLVEQKPVKTFCLKADFAESSGTHNTGAANFINEVLINSDILTPPQKVDNTVRSTIYGFPILMFHQETEDSPRVFIGKYNFNNDKSTQDTFGFEKIAGYNKGMINRDDYLLYSGSLATLQTDSDALKEAEDDGEYLMYLIDDTTDTTYYNHLVEYDTTAGSWVDKGELWLWDAENKCWSNTKGLSFNDGLAKVEAGMLVENNCECWEFTNNGNAMCLFHASDFDTQVYGDDIPDWFDTDWLPTDSEGKKHAPYWATAFEPRYPDNDNMFKHYAQGRIPKQLKRLCDWLSSLNVLDENLTEEEKSTMDLRFLSEYQQYFHKESLLSYDLIREGLLAADQGAKNMMWAFFDGLCYPIFYDNDTILGLNNEGRNQFSPYSEPHSKDSLGKFVFNGESSVIWNLIERNLESEKNVIYERMVSQGGFTYERAIYWFNTRQSDMWSETIYNQDSQYKYIDSYGSASEEDGSAQDYLEIAQGSREEHRKWMLYERFAYLNSKRCTGTYRESSVYLRANTNGDSVVPYNVAVDVTAAQDWYFGFRFSGNAGYSSRLLAENETFTFTAPQNSTPNDTETYIYQADRIKSLGDLSALYPTTLVVGSAKLLEDLIVGNETVGYIGKLATLTLGTHPLLKLINVVNCPTLQTSLNVTGCSALETIYAQGSKITAVNLPVGSVIKEMHLPETLVQIVFDRLPYLRYENLTIDGFTNVQTVNINSCAKLDAMKILEDIINTPGNTLQYVRVTDIDLQGDGQVLLDMMHLKGAENKNGAPELIGRYTLTRYMADDDYNKIVNCYPYLEIINQEYTVIHEDDNIEDEARLSNLDNSTGYLFSTAEKDVPYEPSGHVSKILAKRHAVLAKHQGDEDGKGVMLYCKLSNDDYNNYYDGTTANLMGDRGSEEDQGDVFMLEPHYWYKGINDYLNAQKFKLFSANDAQPSSIATTKKVLLSELEVQVGKAVASRGIDVGVNVNDQIKTYDTFSTYIIKVNGFKQVRWPGVASGSYCSVFVDVDNNVIKVVRLTSYNGFQNGDYLFTEIPENAESLYFTAPASLDTNLYADWCVLTTSSNISEIEPNWVEHEECLVGMYKANYENDILRSISGVTPSVSISQYNFSQYAASRGTGFQLVDYEMSKDVANLFYAKYGRLDSQKQCGYGSGSNTTKTGLTDFLGMTDTINPNNATSGGYYYDGQTLKNATSIKCMGYDNWFGNVSEWMDFIGCANGAVLTDSLGKDRTTKVGVRQITLPDGNVREVLGTTTSDKYIIRVRNGRYMDTISAYDGGTSSTYYCDYTWFSSSLSRVVLRSGYDANAYCGVAYAYAYSDSANTSANDGSRLAFRGILREAESVEIFKAAAIKA